MADRIPAAGSSSPRFACDAMLCGLARWLRAWGYDATWTYGVGDAELLGQARREGRVVLTADSGILRRRRVRARDPQAVAIRNDAAPLMQLRGLVETLDLPRSSPRCMACGGFLARVEKSSVADEAPPRTFGWLEEFFRCRRCGRLFWKGTHYQSIQERLAALSGS